jgi:flavorubredoxin
MDSDKIREGIYWVGAIDWDVRNFHGYLTEQGTSYNSYLLIDEKITLVDTVKEEKFGQMMDRISRYIDPSRIDYVLSNHVEMDHSGGIPQLMELIPQATVITSKAGEKGLRRHFKKDWNFQVVKSGDSISTGKWTLSFVNTPMVHWPDSMVTYLPEEKILFSNDAFGQHLATPERFDDELGLSVIKKDAAKYYANIVLPFGKQVQKALSSLSSLDIDLIAPSHGLMWRSYVSEIVSEYQKWSSYESENKALIVYDSMWKSTEKMANALEQALSGSGIKTTLRNLKVNHISDIMSDVMNSKLILLGSPTLNNGMLPTMGQFLTYLKGLRPKNKIGFAFGSYGWGGQAVKELDKAIEELNWERPLESLTVEYVPGSEDLTGAGEIGKSLAEFLLKSA